MQRRVLLWLLPVFVCTAAFAGWLLWRARSREPAAASRPQSSALPANGDVRLRAVLELARKKDDPRSADELVALYAKLAGDPTALTARRLVLNVLLAEPAMGLRLKRLLEAVSLDPTPPPEDPLWPDVVAGISEQWSNAVFAKGRDLMLMETRPRARRALIASFVELTKSGRADELDTEQAQALLTDLIDMHARAEAEQRPQIEEAVRRLGGNDPADLLASHGLSDGKQLELQAEYERNLRVGLDTLGKGKPLPTE
jgi:hypothetical protein